ncbi:MAG: DNA-protecting protein DprA [Bacteroidota bacterium]|jgi:DNA processing protein
MPDDLLYRLALTMIPELGPVRCKILIDHFGTAEAIFKARKKELSLLEGIGSSCATSIKNWHDFNRAEKEIGYLCKHQIQPLFLTDKHYPKRLLHCFDPPTLLFYKGNADLNCSRIISIIGTRNHTEYGKQLTEQLIWSLQSEQVLVVSGLAFGIDAIAHRTALQQHLNTVGVLGHGLDSIYPAQHISLAREMILQGGLLTEFGTGSKPDKHNFPKRNRIVAGMCDATIVIETAVKGGSMITAELAFNYNRDLFAFPGRIGDNKSSGCLQLIRQNKACLITGADQLLDSLGWLEKKKKIRKQKELFVQLTENEQTIVALLNEQSPTHIDTVYLQSGLSSSKVAAALLNLEMQQVIISLPGKMYLLG